MVVENKEVVEAKPEVNPEVNPEVVAAEEKPLAPGEQAVLDEMNRDRVEDTEEKPEEKKEDKPKEEKPKEEKPDENDDGGIPWKNRAKESERKHTELLDKITRGEFTPRTQTQKSPEEVRGAIVAKLQKQYPDLEGPQLNAMVDVAIDIGGGMVSHATQSITPALADLHIETAKKGITESDKKFLDDHASDIDEVVKQIPVQARLTTQGATQALQNAILHVRGKVSMGSEGDIEKRVNAAVAAAVKDALKNRRIYSGGNEASADAGGGKVTSAKLTPEQQKDAGEKGLEAKDYSVILKRRQASAKAKGLKIPQTLG